DPAACELCGTIDHRNCEFMGCISMGSSVTDTVSSGFIDDNCFKNNPEVLQLGMLASLLGAGLRLVLCSTPVSTTHSFISSLGSVSLVANPRSLNTEKPGLLFIVVGFTGIIAWIHGHHCRALHGLGHRCKLSGQHFATSVGSKALILRQAVAIATVYSSCRTSVSSLLNACFHDSHIISSLGGASLVANPQSLNTEKTGLVALSWLTSPLLSGIIEASAFLLARMTILRSPHAVSRDHWQGEPSFGSRVANFRSGLSLSNTFGSMAAARRHHFSLVAFLVLSPVAAHMEVITLGNVSDYQANYAWIYGHHCRALQGMGRRRRHFSLAAFLVSSPVASHMAVTAQLGNVSDHRANSLGFKSIIAGLFMAWGIGADYVANSFATSVGSKALILRQAVAIATVYEFVGCISRGADPAASRCHRNREFVGCISMGSSVTDTVRSGFFVENRFKNNPEVPQLGISASLLGQSLALAALSEAWRPLGPSRLNGDYRVRARLPHTWESRHSSATFQITWQITLGFTGIIAGLFMAWGIGANDVANSFATSMGSKALMLKSSIVATESNASAVEPDPVNDSNETVKAPEQLNGINESVVTNASSKSAVVATNNASIVEPDPANDSNETVKAPEPSNGINESDESSRGDHGHASDKLHSVHWDGRRRGCSEVAASSVLVALSCPSRRLASGLFARRLADAVNAAHEISIPAGSTTITAASVTSAIVAEGATGLTSKIATAMTAANIVGVNLTVTSVPEPETTTSTVSTTAAKGNASAVEPDPVNDSNEPVNAPELLNGINESVVVNASSKSAVVATESNASIVEPDPVNDSNETMNAPELLNGINESEIVSASSKSAIVATESNASTVEPDPVNDSNETVNAPKLLNGINESVVVNASCKSAIGYREQRQHS
ncbi:unnamed protein product, partial [Polarella glacialis]